MTIALIVVVIVLAVVVARQLMAADRTIELILDDVLHDPTRTTHAIPEHAPIH